MTALMFDVVGKPTPQGSKHAFVNKHTGRAQMKEQTGQKLADWRQDVKYAALDALGKRAEQAAAHEQPWPFPIQGAVEVQISFAFDRPKNHFGTGRNATVLKDTAPAYPIGRNVGDIEKLVRSTHDALTAAGVWADDSQAVHIDVWKVYVGHEGVIDKPGASIFIHTMDHQPLAVVPGRRIETASVQEALL